MVELIKSVIDAFGFREIYTAEDGDEGFELFCRHNPDLVISDWMMKPTNGIEMAHKIRQNDKSPNKYVPIILLTGFSQKKRVIEARDNGITEFIVKPFKAGDLYKRIENIVEAPRKFIESEDFFGPDRRRRRNPDFRGPLKRETDYSDQKSESIGQEDKVFTDIIKQQNEEKQEVAKNLQVDMIENKPNE